MALVALGSVAEGSSGLCGNVVTWRGRDALFLAPCTLLWLVCTFGASISGWVGVCAFWAPVARWAAVLDRQASSTDGRIVAAVPPGAL